MYLLSILLMKSLGDILKALKGEVTKHCKTLLIYVYIYMYMCM